MVPIVYHPDYSLVKLPQGHRFPMQVFRHIFEKLKCMKLTSDSHVHVPKTMPNAALIGLAHCPQYIEDFMCGTLDQKKLRRIGFPWSRPLVTRTLSEIAGTLLTAELALVHGVSCSCAGGTHHAHRSFGSGFCIFNDLAITASSLIQRRLVDRVLILDLDVHQGDGTASIFNEHHEHKDKVFTFSMHCESNFPARKSNSTLDISLLRNTGDDEYLGLLAGSLSKVLKEFAPQIVLYDAGIDIHKEDVLGHLQITDQGLYRRDRLVIDTCLAWEIPVAGYVGGGYSDNLDILAERHCFLHKAANELLHDYTS